MIAIDNSQALRYEDLLRNKLTTSFAWALGGTALSSAGTVTFAAPTSGTTATGTPILDNGAIVGVNITNAGSGYTTAPALTFSASGVTGVATVEDGVIKSIEITNSGGRTFTVTDNTVYPSGDSRAAANIVLHDRYGHKYPFSITSGNSATISLGTKLLNIGSYGLAAEVTVTSALDKIKDGSAYNIGQFTSGVFTMEK